jgi:hypothetical protein
VAQPDAAAGLDGLGHYTVFSSLVGWHFQARHLAAVFRDALGAVVSAGGLGRAHAVTGVPCCQLVSAAGDAGAGACHAGDCRAIAGHCEGAARRHAAGARVGRDDHASQRVPRSGGALESRGWRAQSRPNRPIEERTAAAAPSRFRTNTHPQGHTLNFWEPYVFLPGYSCSTAPSAFLAQQACRLPPARVGLVGHPPYLAAPEHGPAPTSLSHAQSAP